MVSHSKLYAQLDFLESELKKNIVPHLEAAADGNNDLVFCVKQFNSFNELKERTDKTTDDLVNIGAKILVLKNKLGEPSEGSIAERICWYCREWSNLKYSRRKNAQDFAKKFLEEIKND
jgi:hypothetical protein